MKPLTIDATTVRSVVEHMNDDHADACLIIVRMLGNKHDAQGASMVNMDTAGVDFSVSLSEDKTEHIRVMFDRALTEESQIRGRVVALAKRARAMQDKSG